MTEIIAIIDLQYGSTGKGQIAGTIAHRWEPDTVVTAWGPNAGHTFRMGNRQWVHRMLATSALAPSVLDILIGPGSVVDLSQLRHEILHAQDLLQGKHLVIHPQAAILRDHHAKAEGQLLRVGSTMKGTAEAAIEKMRRDVDLTPTAGTSARLVHESLLVALHKAQMSLAISSMHYDDAVDASQKLIMEGAQGYSLGIHTDFYPYTTSRDVSTAQLFADCRVPLPRNLGVGDSKIIGVCRTYPIRVANRRDPGTNQEFSSGECYRDQEEITWASIGRDPELTTVTRLPRRIFTFSDQQVREAARICTPDLIALTFADYLPPEQVDPFVQRVREATQARVGLVSYGPNMEDVKSWNNLTRKSDELPGQFIGEW